MTESDREHVRATSRTRILTDELQTKSVMESVNSVKVENLKVEKGVSTWHSNVLKSIDKLEDQINQALANPDEFSSRDMDKLLSTIKADMTSISKKHKEIHNPLLKMGKIIDKNFESGDFNPVGVTNVFDTSNKDDLLKGWFNAQAI